MYIYRGDCYWPSVDFLEDIELEGNLNLFASVWKADDEGKMVITRDGKIIIGKEPSSMLMRLLGNQLDQTILLLMQCVTSTSLDDAEYLVRQQVRPK